jgi:hypothetical protein
MVRHRQPGARQGRRRRSQAGGMGVHRQLTTAVVVGCVISALAVIPGAAAAPGSPAPAGAAATGTAAAVPSGPPWIPVHPERKHRLIGAPIGEVCFDGTPPMKLAGKPPELPPSSVYRRLGGVLVAHCLVDDEGYVVEAQLWKTLDPADRQAVERALAGWRFAPARRRDGRPSAVHFTVTIPIARDRGR